MFDSMFGSLFGPSQSSQPNSQISQLYRLHATFRFAMKTFLDEDIKSSDGLGSQIQAYSMELYNLIEKTCIVDEYEHWGYDGRGAGDSTKRKINATTSNTMDAVFALINDKKSEFDRLVKEGPTPKELKLHQEMKQRHQDYRTKYLEKQEKIANCDHDFLGLNTGFFMTKGSCTKCGVKEK